MAQNQLKQLRPKVEAFKSTNGRSLANGSENKPEITQESEQLLTRFDTLDANIDTWVEQVETANKQVKEFQVSSIAAYLMISCNIMNDRLLQSLHFLVVLLWVIYFHSLQMSMKTATGDLSDLDDHIDGFEAISRDSQTIRQQLDDIRTLETELASKEDAMAQLETQCRRLTHSGYVQEPQLYKVCQT